MNAESDHQLLRAYAFRRNEAAFRELVRRYTDFVYSAALRQVESDAIARDLTQSVFTDLVRRAPDILGKHTGESLAGWLHRATRYAALNHLRDSRRRRDNERQAMEQLLTDSESSAEWEQIQPTLDEALDSLDDSDREALLLRYCQNQDFRTVGAHLGVSDDAAQKRVSRAVERLREFFAKRGVTVGAGGLVVVISTNAVQAAPAGLAVTISAAALAGTAVTTSTILAATTQTIAMTTLQKTLVTATIVVLAGAGIYEVAQNSQLRDQVQTLQQTIQQQASLTEQIQELQSERDDAANRLAELVVENTRLKANPERIELLKLRGEMAEARRAVANATAKVQNLRNDSEKSQAVDQRNQTRANLETFFKLTNLSRETADQYVDLEVEMKRRQDERMKALLSGTLSVAEAARQRDQDKQSQEDQRRALLGPDGWATLQSIADGMREGVAKRFIETIQANTRNYPLTQEQTDRLHSAIKAEVAANTMDDTDLFRPVDEWTQMVTDRQQHVVQAASEFLTPAQQETLQFLERANLAQLLQQREQRRKAIGIDQ